MSAFFKENEREEGKILFKQFLPEDVAFEEELLEPETDGGVFTAPLYTLKAVISRQKQAEEYAITLFSKLSPEDWQAVQDSLPDRIDDDCNLYLRLDKKAFADGQIIIHTRDAVHVKIKLACFPKKKEVAVKIAQELMNASTQSNENTRD